MSRNSYKNIPINTSKNTHEKVFFLVNSAKDSKIVDIPSGAGAFIERLKDNGYNNIFAVDIQNILEIEHDNFLKGDMTKTLPLENGSIDTLVCIDGIEHIDEQIQFVREINRVLKKGGEFIVSTPNISSLRSRWKWFFSGHHYKCSSPLDENNPNPLHHIAMISFSEMRYILHSNGFKIEKIETNRIKPIAWIYSLFIPLIYLVTSSIYSKTGKKEGTAQINNEIKKDMFSKEILFGETLIIKAVKV